MLDKALPDKERFRHFARAAINLQLPLRYRPLGEKSWRPGTTENISRSGLLFQAEELLHPNAQLEISLVLPPEIAGLPATEGDLQGRSGPSGREAAKPEVHPALAAKILQYHFQHGAHVGEA